MSLALGSPHFPLVRGPLRKSPPATLSPAPGLRRLHALTTQATYELHVDLEDFDNSTAYARYGSFGVGLFSVDPEEDGYPLTVADYSGTAGRGTEGRGAPACLPTRKDRGTPRLACLKSHLALIPAAQSSGAQVGHPFCR